MFTLQHSEKHINSVIFNKYINVSRSPYSQFFTCIDPLILDYLIHLVRASTPPSSPLTSNARGFASAFLVKRDRLCACTRLDRHVTHTHKHNNVCNILLTLCVFVCLYDCCPSAGQQASRQHTTYLIFQLHMLLDRCSDRCNHEVALCHSVVVGRMQNVQFFDIV